MTLVHGSDMTTERSTFRVMGLFLRTYGFINLFYIWPFACSTIKYLVYLASLHVKEELTALIAQARSRFVQQNYAGETLAWTVLLASLH